MGLEEDISMMGYKPNDDGTDMDDAQITYQKDEDGEMVGILVGVNQVARIDMEQMKEACQRILEIW